MDISLNKKIVDTLTKTFMSKGNVFNNKDRVNYNSLP